MESKQISLWERAREYMGPTLVVLLAAFPFILWILMKPLDTRFITFTTTFTSFGQILGLVGMALFAISLILSARFGFVSNLFGGLNKEYNIHHMTGIIGFFLLLLHPLFLAIKYVPVSLVSASLFLLPGTDTAVNLGIYALLALIALIVITMFAHFKYPVLKGTHKFLGVVFMVGGLHAFLVPSDIARDPVLRWYMIGLTVFALGAYFYRTVLGSFLVRRFSYKVTRAIAQGDGVVEIEMEPYGVPLQHRPGQFLFLSLHSAGIAPEVHPFSISSSPTESALRIAVKALGDYTGTLSNLRPGALAKIEGPFGKFFYERPSTRNKIWVAGGIGITPFLSMARAIGEREEHPHFGIDLYYCTKADAELLYLDELNSISQKHPNFRVIPFVSSKNGFLTASKIGEMSNGIHDKDFFVCGPPPMMEGLKKQLRELKVPRSRIHLEQFKLL